MRVFPSMQFLDCVDTPAGSGIHGQSPLAPWSGDDGDMVAMLARIKEAVERLQTIFKDLVTREDHHEGQFKEDPSRRKGRDFNFHPVHGNPIVMVGGCCSEIMSVYGITGFCTALAPIRLFQCGS